MSLQMVYNVHTMKKLENLILRYLDNPLAIFVFPTGVAARQWAEHILQILPEGEGSVAMDKFIAWDQFKSASIKSQKPDKKSIPSVLRQMFAADYIGKNAEQSTPLLKSLIPPEYRETAGNYADWIAGLLPQLKYWTEQRAPNNILTGTPDAEDYDLLSLYTAYNEFLTANNLFDPAWEKPPFHGSNNEHYYIVYPDALSDFDDYRELLTDSESKGLVTLVYRTDIEDAGDSSTEQSKTVYNYTNSRTELRLLALHLREAHFSEHIAWSDMAVSIADTETYGPYLTRELDLYDIPYQYRVGKPLAKRGAGQLFSQLASCVSQQFSYDSVKALLTNPTLPWKDLEATKQLIAFGQKNCCICAYTKDGKPIDPWKQAFEEATNAYQEQRAEILYDTLKKDAVNIVQAKSFADIKKHYFSFREDLLDYAKFTEDDDRILGRCISELAALIDVEKEYPDVQLPNAYSFFCQVLTDCVYVPQTQEKRGVHIYEYKAAAAAPFQRHFILDASQSSLQVTFTRLLFLRSEKRDALHVAEIDASREYIAMYAQNSAEPARFSCAEKTFGSFSIPHSSFAIHGEDVPKAERKLLYDRELAEWNAKDPYLTEKIWYLQNDSSDSGNREQNSFLKTQAAGFESWQIHQYAAKSLAETVTSDTGTEDYKAIINLYSNNPEKRFRVSKSAVQTFVECPRKWYMSRIAKIKEDSLSAGLLDDSWKGTQLHAIMEKFFKTFSRGTPLVTWNQEYAQRLDTVINQVYADLAKDTKLCPMSRNLVQDQKSNTAETLHNALEILVNSYPGFSVYAQEAEYIYTPETSDGTDPGYDLTGRIDLLLLDPTGQEIIIIDYKSGTVPTVAQCKADSQGELADLQLAMYKLLLEKGRTPDGNTDTQELKVGTPRFFKISDGSFVPGFSSRSAKLELTEAEESKVLEYTEYFAAAVMSGIYAPLHRIDSSSCGDCEYKRLCRTSFKIHGESIPAEGIPDTFFYNAD